MPNSSLDNLFEDLPPLLTSMQIEDILQIKRATLRRWIKEGHLPGVVKVGSQWRMTRTGLRAYLENQLIPLPKAD